MAEIEHEHVHVGRDGWLFLTAGSNNVVGQFSRSPFMARRLTEWKRLLVARTRRGRALGTGYLHVIVPEKLTVYDHKLDGLKVAVRLSPATRLRRSLFWHRAARRACLDLVGAFREQRDAQDLFYRTDSHWNFFGCQLAYRTICAAVGARPCADFEARSHSDIARTGDLGEKLDPPVSEVTPVYALQRDAVRAYASPIVRAREAAGEAHKLHVGAHVIYRNESEAADPRRIVLFGDSYAHFAPIMLTIMLAETFREVHFIWSSAIDWGYVARTKPDWVIAQVAERFLFRVPDDAFDLDRYAAERFGAELAGAPV